MDQTELIEHDPTLEVGATTSDSMQRFNLATQPIRDALRSVEGVKLPSVNIVAWIAVNVKSATVVESGGMDGKEEGKFKVVMGGEGERERIERERLAEAQRWVSFLFGEAVLYFPPGSSQRDWETGL